MNDEFLIQRHLDGTLATEEYALFNQRLREDVDLRAYLREIATQAVAMGDFARATKSTVTPAPKPSHVRFGWGSPLAFAASFVLLGASVWLWMGRRDLPVLTLVDASGSVSWSQGGELRVNVKEGETLTEGMLETLGETSTAQFRFQDGTLITLSGETELSFSEDRQKLLVLRKGSLSAQVKPQPNRRPMIVRTPSAEAEIVGTTFNLSARPDDTLLKVEEGRVRLKRLADGTSIDVPAKSSAVASLVSALKLDLSVTPEPLTSWSFDFTNHVPPRIWRGVWHDTPEGGRMVASPYVANKAADGSIITHFGVSVRTAYLSPALAMLVSDQSILRYRLKQAISAPLQVMLLTNTIKGGYGGNFECKLPAEELKPDADGWCDIEIPITRFKSVEKRPQVSARHLSPIGNVVTSFLLSSFKTDTGLTVAKFELHTQP